MRSGHRAMAVDVVLIGRRLAHNENLGIGYLLAALRAAGLTAEFLPLRTWPDVTAACERVGAASPAVVGLALPDGGSAFLPLTVGALLRDGGYAGHITAGGAFATLARRWLLERYSWLDSVVRFAGEVPLVELAKGVLGGDGSVAGIGGLTTRTGDGRPAPVLDETLLELEPVHEELPRLVGHGVAHMLATRGCTGRCAYCGPAALGRLERDEGARAGHARATLTRAGVGGVRRRSLESICDEMAALWHERDVRYFYFVDEHLLPRGQDQALDWLSRWRLELARRQIQAPAIGCMLRGDRLSPPVLRAFVALGLVRCFVGLELGSEDELRRFGRGGDPARALGTIAELERLGVSTTCNLMLVHPYSTPATIAGGIRLLKRLRAVPVEATHMQVYHGTRLHERLAAEGRLVGNPIRWGYTFDDPVVRRFGEILARLRVEAFGDYSVAFQIHDVRLALALARRLARSIELDDLQQRCHELTERSGSIRIHAYEQALHLAQQGCGYHRSGELLASTQRAVAAIARELDRIHGQIGRRLSLDLTPFAPMRAAAAKMVSFCLTGAALAGCHDGPGAPTPVATTPAVVPVPAPPPPSTTPAPASEPEVPGPEPSTAAGSPDAAACTIGEQRRLEAKVAAIAKEIDPCGSRTVAFAQRIRSPPVDSYAYDYRPGSPSAKKDPAIERQVQKRLRPEELACLVDRHAAAIVQGKDNAQRNRMRDTVNTSCKTPGVPSPWFQVIIELDATGKVIRVSSQPQAGATPNTLQCVVRVLQGLTFPCLAGQRIVPESVIIE